MRAGTFVLLWFAVGKGVFPIDWVFLVHRQPFQFFLSAFNICVWMSEYCLISSASCASPCPLSHLRSRHTPFYAVDFLSYSWGFDCFFFFFSFSHQHVYEHFAQDLLGCLEIGSGRITRGRKMVICQVSWRETMTHHLVDPFSVDCHCCWFPSPVTLSQICFLW